MKIRFRLVSAFLTALLIGFYAAFLTFYFRDSARPFGFGQEYSLGVLFSLGFCLFILVWLSIGIDWASQRIRLGNGRKYGFKWMIYFLVGSIPVLLTWFNSTNPDARLFYPRATFFPVTSLVYYHVLIGIDTFMRFTRKH